MYRMSFFAIAAMVATVSAADCPTYIGRQEVYPVNSVVLYNGANYKVVRTLDNGWITPDNAWFWQSTTETCAASSSSAPSSSSSPAVEAKLDQLLANQVVILEKLNGLATDHLRLLAQIDGNFIDPRDGKTYGKVTIGTQTWMAQNLQYNAVGSVCENNDPDQCAISGRMYDWDQTPSLCPTGWHLPSAVEWEALYSSVGGRSVAGKMLKASTGFVTQDLNGFNFNGIDAYGFHAVPNARYQPSTSQFYNELKSARWWTSAGPLGGGNAFATCAFTDEMTTPDYASTSCSAPRTMKMPVRCLRN